MHSFRELGNLTNEPDGLSPKLAEQGPPPPRSAYRHRGRESLPAAVRLQKMILKGYRRHELIDAQSKAARTPWE